MSGCQRMGPTGLERRRTHPGVQVLDKRQGMQDKEMVARLKVCQGQAHE